MPGEEILGREAERPLHGDWVYGLKISQSTGRRELTKRMHAMELGRVDRAQTTIDEQYPGIGIIDLFEARGVDYQAIPLEDAIKRAELRTKQGYTSVRFLISVATSGLAVVSSRIGYEMSGNVHVLPPSQYSPYTEEPREVHMRDYARSVDDELLTRRHIERLGRRDIDPRAAIAQTAVDDTFRYLQSCSPERR